MSKKLVWLPFVLLTIFCFVAGCGDSSPKDANDWSYSPPEEFKQQDKANKNKTVFLGPSDDGFQANLLVEAQTNDNQSAKEIAEGVLDLAKKENPVAVIEQEPYTLADSDCYTWLISRTGKSGRVAKQRQFFVKKNKVVVRFLMTASEKTMDKWDQVLADSLKTFKWGH